MKKLFTALLLIIIAIIVIAPKIMGSQYQTQLTNLVKAINATPPYQATIVKQDNGWFGSQSTLEVSVDVAKVDPELAKELGQDTLKSDVIINAHYGPLIINQGVNAALFSVDSQIQGDDLRKTLTWQKDTPLFQFTGSQSLTGKFTFSDEITPFTGSLPTTKSDVNFSGYKGHGSWVNNHFTYESALEDASIKDVSTIGVKGLTTKLNFDGNIDNLIQGGLSNSDMTIAMKELNIEPLLTAQGVLLTFTSKLNNTSQIGAINVKANVDTLNYQDESASDLTFDVALNNLNNAFFKEYASFNQQQNQTNNADAQSAAALSDFLHAHTVEFFKTTPELIIKDAHGTLPEGKFTIQFDGHLKPDDKATLEQLNQPAYWLTHLTLNSTINADKTLTQALAKLAIEEQLASDPDIGNLTDQEYEQLVNNQAQVLIKQGINQGAIVIKDGMYRVALSIKDGNALLNGKPSPLLNLAQ